MLGKSPKQVATPNQKTTATEPEEQTEAEKAERRESLRRSLNITSWSNTFGSFKLIKGTEEAHQAFKDISRLPEWKLLLCYGVTGCGKTHLCEALAISLAGRGLLARVNEWGEMMRRWKRLMHSELRGAYDEDFERFRNVRFMIIDDVGMGGSGSDYEWGELEDIIRYRYHQGMYTVITTNLDLKTLPARVVSRFRDGIQGRVVLNEGKDYRPQRGR